jgi:Rho GDP-dissociation inhibitor
LQGIRKEQRVWLKYDRCKRFCFLFGLGGQTLARGKFLKTGKALISEETFLSECSFSKLEGFLLSLVPLSEKSAVMSGSPIPPPKPPKPSSSTSSESVDGKKEVTKVSDILALDTEDESLRKYKESLLGTAAKGDLGDVNDPRRLIIDEFRVCFAPEEGLPDIVHQLSTAEGVSKLSHEGITMKEGCKFKFRITFRAQHEIVAGVKFVSAMTRMMVTDTDELMLGSYPPSSQQHVFEFPKWDYNEAPKGMLFRGKYKVVNSFIDSDKNKHLEFSYDFQIVSK